MPDPVYRMRARERPEYIEPGDLVETEPGVFREVVSTNSVSNENVAAGSVIVLTMVNGGYPFERTARLRYLTPDESPGETP